MSILSSILGWLTGGGIAAIGKQLNEAYANRLKATTDHEKLEADRAISTLQAQQAVLIAEQGSWMTRWIRPAIALPFTVYLWKLVIWDKVLGMGATDDLSPNLWWIMGSIITAYFLTRPFEKR